MANKKMQEAKLSSPRRSLKGFKLSKNFINTLKNMAMVLAPAIITEAVAQNWISTAIAALAGPMLLKGLEYWFKEKV